jgi:cytochrome c553
MTDEAQEPRSDERLEQLLVIETRLQDLVRAAEKRAAARIAAAHEARDRRLVEAHAVAAQADAARSRDERLAHEQALAAIEREHQVTLAAFAGLSDERIDELARWALGQVIGASGDAA